MGVRMPELSTLRLRARIGEYVRRIRSDDDFAPGRSPTHAPRKLYRVSEIAQHLGLTRQTLHNYATIGLITEEARTPGGQRLFDESIFPRLNLIRQMKHTHRLHEIRRLLDGPHAARATVFPAAVVDETPPADQPDSREASASFAHDPRGDLAGPDIADRALHGKETCSREEPPA